LLRHVSVHAGTIIKEQSRAWLKLRNGFSVLVGTDAVNVMATYQPDVQACGTARLHNRLICESVGKIKVFLIHTSSLHLLIAYILKGNAYI
jgi:hypothetical protein